MGFDNRTRELVAIGASITANCLPCLKYHIDKALENGVNDHEIAEAMEVGKTVRKGASAKMNEFISGLDHAASATSPRSEGCVCG